jgi:uncharacterized RDD family membrane protein YckC
LEKEEYTIVVDGKPQGPFELAELKNLNIVPETFVRKPGMSDYKEAHEMPELRSYLGFNVRQVVPQYYASFDQRLVADVLDYLLLIPVYLLLAFGAYFIASLNVFRVVAIALALLLPWVRLIYGSIAEASAKQATIGKRIMELKVTDLEGNRLSMANSFGRNFSKIISNIPLCIGYLFCFFTKKQQCLHDLIAETLVVKQRLL